MASLWAQERAMNVLKEWDKDQWLSRSKLVELMADAIEDAEEYGENRYKDNTQPLND